ncbi:MAG: hypothetical protein A3E91_02880 [Candidatus Moranbacteria bacterium RIFCSPHIGHO2_12_FULL_40_10]|nr:MAG: hypothetical protein A3E91_02880 [Candidatus Moranbacteria bacterium RIFCSPHIGHO2_12_FULL_40_10]
MVDSEMEYKAGFHHLWLAVLALAVFLFFAQLHIDYVGKKTVTVYKCGEFEYEAPKRNYCEPGKYLFVGTVVSFRVNEYKKNHGKDKVYLSSEGNGTGEYSLHIVSDNLPDENYFKFKFKERK